MKGKVIAGLIVIVLAASTVSYVVFGYLPNLPKYDWAVVQGTVNNVYQTRQGWYYNVSLLKGTDALLPKIEPINVNNHHPSPYPTKQNGIWIYIFRTNCNLFKATDSVYLKTAIQDKYIGYPSGVLGYWLDGDGSELAPSFMQDSGATFVGIVGC